MNFEQVESIGSGLGAEVFAAGSVNPEDKRESDVPNEHEVMEFFTDEIDRLRRKVARSQDEARRAYPDEGWEGAREEYVRHDQLNLERAIDVWKAYGKGEREGIIKYLEGCLFLVEAGEERPVESVRRLLSELYAATDDRLQAGDLEGRIERLLQVEVDNEELQNLYEQENGSSIRFSLASRALADFRAGSAVAAQRLAEAVLSEAAYMGAEAERSAFLRGRLTQSYLEEVRQVWAGLYAKNGGADVEKQ